ncbi:MAG: rhomboid family intramembrane serine protease [Firmicutes bacterium]|nr:rhomboid family intramembrane serine protease [Bacillota bacterium]
MYQADKKKPVVTISLVIINSMVFLVMEMIGDTEDTAFMMEMGASWPPYILDGQCWRFFTSTFMHFGFEHIMNNMLVLACAGPILEKAMGHIKYLILYIVAGVGGSAFSFLQMLYSDKYAVAAGASGAIFGIIGALLWIVIRHKGRYETLTGKGLLFMIVISLYYGISSGEVDNWGHIGGLVMGFLMSVIFYQKPRKTVDFNDENTYTYE